MTKLRFLVSLTTSDNDYQIEQAESAEAAARKLNIGLQIVYAANDAINQSTQILKVIQSVADQRPNAVVFEPVGGTSRKSPAPPPAQASPGPS
jgi:ABC-type sugar transport system substrate-binding protein